jgi:PilZ domain-containing protein
VRRVIQSDRRHEERLPQSLEVMVSELPQLGSIEHPELCTVKGRVQNISHHGVCVVTSSPIEKASLIRCEIAIGDAPLLVATLMQVRWTRKQIAGPDSFISGLEAIL